MKLFGFLVTTSAVLMGCLIFVVVSVLAEVVA